MNATPDHFALFGLAPRFALDLAALDAAYKRVQSQVHPDRFASATAAEKRVAMQWAVQANEALQTLRSPARRAAYLCERNGAPIEAESNTAMPPAFLMQQLEWREALDAGRRGAVPLQALARQTDRAREGLLAELTAVLDSAHNYIEAAALVRQLMFIDKFRDEIENASHALEAAPSNAS